MRLFYGAGRWADFSGIPECVWFLKAKGGFLRLCIFYERSDFSGISVMIRISAKFFSHTQV
jgi:hypothetical protein